MEELTNPTLTIISHYMCIKSSHCTSYTYIILFVSYIFLKIIYSSLWLRQVLAGACRLLAAACGIERGPPAWGAWSLNHWTTREVPCQLYLNKAG